MDHTKLRWRTGVGDRQRRRILLFVQEFGRREGYSPSQREIAEELRLAVSTVSYHVSVLEQEGSLRRGPGQPRTIVEPACPQPGRRATRSRCRSSGISRPASPWTPWSRLRRPFLLSRRLVGRGALFMLRVKGTR